MYWQNHVDQVIDVWSLSVLHHALFMKATVCIREYNQGIVGRFVSGFHPFCFVFSDAVNVSVFSYFSLFRLLWFRCGHCMRLFRAFLEAIKYAA